MTIFIFIEFVACLIWIWVCLSFLLCFVCFPVLVGCLVNLTTPHVLQYCGKNFVIKALCFIAVAGTCLERGAKMKAC